MLPLSQSLRRVIGQSALGVLVSLVGCKSDGASSTASSGAGGNTSTAATAGSSTSETSASSSSNASSGTGGSSNGCPPNSTQVKTIAACAAGGSTTPPSLAADLIAGARGDILDLAGLDVPSLPCAGVLVCRPNDAATLLFSDEPETTSSDGILYADVLTPGPYRVYVYHVNASSPARKFPVVILNQGADAATITIKRRGLAGPGTDYVSIGKAAVHDWLAGNGAGTLTVPASQRVLLDSDLDALHAGKNDLVHAIIDFDVDRPVKLSVVSVAANTDATVATAGLSVLPNSGLHVRGTFPGAAYTLALDSASGLDVRSMSLGENVVDPDLTGHSFVDANAPETLLGNFGVPYGLVLPFTNRGAVAIAPRGGAWGGGQTMSAGEDATLGYVDLPSSQTTLDVATSAIMVGRFASSATASGTIMTAGGSSLPVSLLVVPLNN